MNAPASRVSDTRSFRYYREMKGMKDMEESYNFSLLRPDKIDH